VGITTLSAALGLACLALIDFRIPPFFGYFIYRTNEALKLELSVLNQKGVYLRVVSGLFAAIGITPTVMSGTLIIVVEIFLNLLTFKRFVELVHLKGSNNKVSKGNRSNRKAEESQLRRLTMIRLLVELFNGIYETKFFARGLALGDSTSTLLIQMTSSECRMNPTILVCQILDFDRRNAVNWISEILLASYECTKQNESPGCYL